MLELSDWLEFSAAKYRRTTAPYLKPREWRTNENGDRRRATLGAMSIALCDELAWTGGTSEERRFE